MAAFLMLVATNGLLIGSAPVRAPRASPASMNLFGDLMAGVTKMQAGSYDEAAVKAKVERMIKMKP